MTEPQRECEHGRALMAWCKDCDEVEDAFSPLFRGKKP